jgi:site-specific DNA-methyltransferase (adenine-specific)
MTLPLNTILCGDCLTLLPGFPSQGINFVLTDPPYIARYRSRDRPDRPLRRQR